MKDTEDLENFWKELKKQACITFQDYERLEYLLGLACLKIDELRKSRDKWREKYESRT